jgi:hypothetical protein
MRYIFNSLFSLSILIGCDTNPLNTDISTRETFESIWDREVEKFGLNAIKQHSCPKVSNPSLTTCMEPEESKRIGKKIALYYELDQTDRQTALDSGIFERDYTLTVYLDDPTDSVFVAPLGCTPDPSYFEKQGLQESDIVYINDFDSIYSM